MADPLDLWILEDDIGLCGLIAEQCQRQHWQLQAFHHPRSLDAALAERSPDLLLLDQMLPEKCGTDILASLRNRNHQFPVLMISAMGAPSDRVLGLESGADDYISKPFLFRELQLRIQNLIDRQPQVTPLPPPFDRVESVRRLERTVRPVQYAFARICKRVELDGVPCFLV
jgi:DNA-binding response OmpR family regulator